MNEIVDRAATALTLTATASGSSGDELLRDIARQVIMALREPTIKMIARGTQANGAKATWQAMIDALLADE